MCLCEFKNYKCIYLSKLSVNSACKGIHGRIRHRYEHICSHPSFTIAKIIDRNCIEQGISWGDCPVGK